MSTCRILLSPLCCSFTPLHPSRKRTNTPVHAHHRTNRKKEEGTDVCACVWVGRSVANGCATAREQCRTTATDALGRSVSESVAPPSVPPLPSPCLSTASRPSRGCSLFSRVRSCVCVRAALAGTLFSESLRPRWTNTLLSSLHFVCARVPLTSSPLLIFLNLRF